MNPDGSWHTKLLLVIEAKLNPAVLLTRTNGKGRGNARWEVTSKGEQNAYETEHDQRLGIGRAKMHNREMLGTFLRQLLKNGDLQSVFYLGEIVLGVLFLIGVWFFRPKSPESNFRVREADLKNSRPKISAAETHTLAEARIQKTTPLQLVGIRIDGEPHEILGIASGATTQEIQKAYRDLMKQYHPDRVGRPGTREWTDAQKIAEAINQAKDHMLKKRG
jgi:hypothetical protein